MEEVQKNDQTISVQEKTFFRKHIIIISVFVVILTVGVIFFVVQLPKSKSISTPITPVSRNEEWIKNEPSNTRSTEVDVNKLLGEFISQLQAGSFDQALSTYNRILNSTDNHYLLTAIRVIDPKKITSLEALEIKINKEKNINVKSELLIEKWKLEYRIWSDLYYQYPEEYWIVVYYYFMRAIKSFDESIWNMDNALAHRHKWVVILDLGSSLTNVAIRELERSIEMDTGDIMSFYKLWNANRSLRKYDAAISAYSSWLLIDPNHELTLTNLGVAYFDKWNRTQWYEIYASLLKKCTVYCNVANYNLANELLNEPGEKDFVKILSLYDKAIEYAQQKGEVYRNAHSQKWKIYLNQKQLPEALEQFLLSLNDPHDRKTDDNIFNQNSEDGLAYYNIVKIYISQWKNDLAQKYLNIWLTRYPKNKELLSLKVE